ncbi:helix-turn-helix domain-containing protein [Paenibacillus ginsengarvi]|uniref:Helix-turn-helix domain-containing protein n=1 Tax=Paenibacillus ginsengarvi TaxID=400777 RepID=A0A3B0BSR1_9BACL|nr:helix-turn-helix domain-containing protein [Paenibacillus ginsengarvi]RKN75047.1 helix-turn-helix domain-containing protein [Paenibacillus ginsengarvi]
MSTLNDRIKQRRMAMNLTLLDVATHLGVKEATAQRYESGDIKNIKHETIVSLSELFKCSPAYLMGWTDDVEAPSTKPQVQTVLSDDILKLIKKFNALDEKGKHTVKTVLEMEYFRVSKPNPPLEVIAAHNDDHSKEQLELMKQDLEDL